MPSAVIGVDMIAAVLGRATANAAAAGIDNVVFRQGLGEELPVPDDWADVVIPTGCGEWHGEP